jgi:hypothetical protein
LHGAFFYKVPFNGTTQFDAKLRKTFTVAISLQTKRRRRRTNCPVQQTVQVKLCSLLGFYGWGS